MDARFFATGLRQVASGLVKLAHSTPDGIDALIGQIHAMACMAAEGGNGPLSAMAQETEAVVQTFAGRGTGTRSGCVEGLGRLGHRLLDDLCATVARADSSTVNQLLQRRVLIVDDSRVATTALLNAFRARDFSTRSAVTLEEAFIELMMFTPDVLVSDVFMPDLEVELLARLFRSLSRGRPNLLVLVSASSGAGLEKRLKDIGPDIYVAKMEGAAKVADKVIAVWDSAPPPQT